MPFCIRISEASSLKALLVSLVRGSTENSSTGPKVMWLIRESTDVGLFITSAFPTVASGDHAFRAHTIRAVSVGSEGFLRTLSNNEEF